MECCARPPRKVRCSTDEMSGAAVVLRQRDLETLAHDQRLNGIGLALFDMMGITDGPLRDWYSRLMFTTEGDYHRRMRSLVSRAFAPRCAEALRATAADMAAAAVASVRQGGDLVAACSTLATRLTCRLLGVPDTDVAEFAQWADALSPVFYVMTREQITDATTAITGLQSYVDELTRRRTQNPGPDLITGLLAAEADGERLTHDETVTMIANPLVAGHDTNRKSNPMQHPGGPAAPRRTQWDTRRSGSPIKRGRRDHAPGAQRPAHPALLPSRRSRCTARRSLPAQWCFSASPRPVAMRRRGATPTTSTPIASHDQTRPGS